MYCVCAVGLLVIAIAATIVCAELDKKKKKRIIKVTEESCCKSVHLHWSTNIVIDLITGNCMYGG